MRVFYSGDALKSLSPDMQNKDGLSVIIAYYNDFCFPFHSHDFNELVIILGGTGKHLVNNETYSLIAGDVFVLKGTDKHCLKDTRNLRFVNIAYSQQKLETLRPDIRTLPGFFALFALESFYRKQHVFKSRFRLGIGDLMFVSELAESMEKEYRSDLSASGSMLTAYFVQLVIYLSRCYTSYYSGAPRNMLAMANVVTYMENNYTEVTSLGELAALADLSVNHFLRIFNKTFNTTPMSYIRQLRIRRACELMKNEGLSITEIAYAVGIEDSNYFSRVFKGIMGISPREYKKKLKGK